MLKEENLQRLLQVLYDRGVQDVYDYTATIFTTSSDEFANTKLWADQLVRDKLAAYTDKGHTILDLTNFGKYWMMKGGYESFLENGQRTKDYPNNKEEHKLRFLHREKEGLIEARIKLISYRLVGFWLTLVISSFGFLLSLYNLYLIMNVKK
jgi:hypothetical protein